MKEPLKPVEYDVKKARKGRSNFLGAKTRKVKRDQVIAKLIRK